MSTLFIRVVIAIWQSPSSCVYFLIFLLTLTLGSRSFTPIRGIHSIFRFYSVDQSQLRYSMTSKTIHQNRPLWKAENHRQQNTTATHSRSRWLVGVRMCRNDKMNENHQFQLVSRMFSHLTTTKITYAAAWQNNHEFSVFAFQIGNNGCHVNWSFWTSTARLEHGKWLSVSGGCVYTIGKYYKLAFACFIVFVWAFCICFALDVFSCWIIPISVRLTQIPYTPSIFRTCGARVPILVCTIYALVSVDMARPSV